MPRAGYIRARPLRQMRRAGPSASSTGALQLCKLWRFLSGNTPRRSLLLKAFPNARTPLSERRPVMRRPLGRRSSGRPAKSYGWLAGLALSITLEAACTAQAVRKAHSPLFRLSHSFVPSGFDGRFRSVARRRANIGCPRGRVLSGSRTGCFPGGSATQPRRTESRKHHARSPRATACLVPTMSVLVSPPSALCSNALSVATMPRRLGSRP